MDDEGKVFVIGRKEYGRLGLGPVDSDATELTAVPNLEKLKCVDVAAGSAQSFAVTEGGKYFAYLIKFNLLLIYYVLFLAYNIMQSRKETECRDRYQK